MDELSNMSDAAIATEVKRVGLLKHVTPEEGDYIDALMVEVKRRFAERRVWLGPGAVLVPAAEPPCALLLSGPLSEIDWFPEPTLEDGPLLQDNDPPYDDDDPPL